MSNRVLNHMKYLAEFYPLDLADIIADCCVCKSESKDWHQFGIVYITESLTSSGLIYKIGKSFWEGRIYQLNRQYNIGTEWKPTHIIRCCNNGLIEKTLHYLFGGPGQVMKDVSRELFCLGPSEISWLQSLNYIDGYRLASAIIRAHTKAVRMHGVRP